MNTYSNPERNTWSSLVKRPTRSYEEIEGLVSGIFSEVSRDGDDAVRKYTRTFDGADLESFTVPGDQFEQAQKDLDPVLKESIELARANIMAFHAAQRTGTTRLETTPGVVCWQEKRPIQKVGLYIPGGTAPLFSTILMLAVPAQLAGCREIVLCTPCDKDGRVDPAVVYTAQLCGIQKIYRVGGIQAIAAMTFGTQSIPQVYKIFGPGNQYVTVAKQMALKFGVAIDLPAGPSELLVMADDSADPDFVASDLLSQAEHGTDSQVILVAMSSRVVERVEAALERQLEVLPRKDIARKALENSRAFVFDSETEAMEFVNEYAPEHLILCTKEADRLVDEVMNAGSVFVGNYTPESAGDYASGTNHTLPTNGFARNFSGVNLDSFCKSVTFQKIDREGLQRIGSAIENMAEAEGLQAHKNAVSLRLKAIKEQR